MEIIYTWKSILVGHLLYYIKIKLMSTLVLKKSRLISLYYIYIYLLHIYVMIDTMIRCKQFTMCSPDNPSESEDKVAVCFIV